MYVIPDIRVRSDYLLNFLKGYLLLRTFHVRVLRASSTYICARPANIYMLAAFFAFL